MVDYIENDEKLIADFCEEVLDLQSAKLPDEYYYSSVPLCVIDSVFSIGVRYEGVRNTVTRYCNYFNHSQYRNGTDLPIFDEQQSVREFIQSFKEHGLQCYVDNVFKNKQRTSSRNGILKAEAVYKFCDILQKYGVEYLQDVKKLYDNKEFDEEIKGIQGQKSGISLVYFYMLAGEDNWIKPDRMIIRFLESVLKRKVKIGDAQNLLELSCRLLTDKFPNVTPRLLDYQIWNYARSNSID